MDLNGVRIDRNFQRMLDSNCKIFQEWYQLFIDRFHLFTLRPDKWAVTDQRLPVVDDVVLFLMSDSGQGKAKLSWKLGVVMELSGASIWVECVVLAPDGKPTRRRFVRSVRDVAVLYGPDDAWVNTSSHFRGGVERL